MRNEIVHPVGRSSSPTSGSVIGATFTGAVVGALLGNIASNTPAFCPW
jgi:hypothetical protein